MTTDAQVVIVGGGIMGVSLAYHLTRRGWRDIVLLEKSELTAGSTWHAAGLCTHFAHNPTIMEMRAASVRLYRDVLPAEGPVIPLYKLMRRGDACVAHHGWPARPTPRATHASPLLRA